MLDTQLTLRAAVAEDGGFAADVFTANNPDEPADPIKWRHLWGQRGGNMVARRFLVLEAERPIGYAEIEHKAWEDTPVRSAWVDARLLPGWKSTDRLDAAYAEIERRVLEEGGELFVAWAFEPDHVAIEVLLRRGYLRDSLEEFRELNLVANQARLLELAEHSRKRMQEQHVSLMTLAEYKHPNRYQQLFECFVEAHADVPRTLPAGRKTLEDFMHEMQAPSVREDRVWIALFNGRVVGQSHLSYPPVRGNVWTSWTGTARSVRGRGVARALKLQTLAQAIELGVTKVRTGNDERNAPILHLNDELGYVRIPGAVELHKRA